MEKLSFEELSTINGGFNWEGIVSGIILGAVGVGSLAIAVTPGLNVIAAAGIAYAGSWGIAGGAMSTVYGLVA
jgi:hypothetical protein